VVAVATGVTRFAELLISVAYQLSFGRFRNYPS